MILVAPDHIESATGRLLATQTAAEQQAISGKYLFESGDIVYSKIRPYLRKAIFATFPGLCSADMYPLRPASDVSPQFLLAVLLGHHFSTYAESVSVRSGMPKINRAELQGYSFASPPLTEQRAIAAVLGDVDKLLEGLARLITKKRDIKQAAMQHLLTGHTRLPGFDYKWERVRLGELFVFKNGLNKSKTFFGHGTPIVNYMDVFGSSRMCSTNLEGRVSLTEPELRAFEVRKGDVFFTRTSETREDVGVASVMLDEPIRTVFSGFVLRARPLNPRLSNEFKAYCFSSAFVRHQITSKASYTTRALTNGRILSEVLLPLPGLREQDAIAAVLSDIDAELSVLETRREKTRALKQALMQELLTGKTRLVEPAPANEAAC